MAEKGIIMSAPNVLALLARRKFRTMRPCKDQTAKEYIYVENCVSYPPTLGEKYTGWAKDCGFSFLIPTKPRYAVGDDLYVKETYKGYWKEQTSLPCNCDYYVEYRADSSKRITRTSYLDRYENDPTHKWKPSIYMPKIFARIWMPCTKVTVQRPQDLSAEECMLEGINDPRIGWADQPDVYKMLWKNLYISIYGEEAWLKNLWHFVYWWETIEIKGE